MARPERQFHGDGFGESGLASTGIEGSDSDERLHTGKHASGEYKYSRWPTGMASARWRAHRCTQHEVFHRMGRQILRKAICVPQHPVMLAFARRAYLRATFSLLCALVGKDLRFLH